MLTGHSQLTVFVPAPIRVDRHASFRNLRHQSSGQTPSVADLHGSESIVTDMAQQKKIILPEDDEALLRQCQFTATRSSGPGGQHVNTTDSAVRLEHLPTGLIVNSQRHRSQVMNRRDCIVKLRTLVARLNYRKPKRTPTRVSRAALERRRKAREKKSQKKSQRRPPSADE